jgi:predicted aldo/keto reductase-like oxidoreductase
MDRCGVDYFDFFMLHNVSEETFDIYTNEKLGFVDEILEQKAKGRIHHLGFSSHGRYDTIEKFLDYLKKRGCNEFEFALIQLNYLDWTLQEANKKYEVLTKHGLSVLSMEPLRGGKLADLGANADKIFKAVRPNDSQAKWAFRYLQSLENVSVVLSGMSTLEQVKENLEIFSEIEKLTPDDYKAYQQVVDTLTDIEPCTSCQYCVEACPQELDIPLLLAMYSEAKYDVGWFLGSAIRALDEAKRPSACTSCSICVPLCPQNIDIPKAIKAFDKRLKA